MALDDITSIELPDTTQPIKRRFFRRKKFITIVSLIIIGFIAVGIFIRKQDNDIAAVSQAPMYKTVLPSGRPINTLGGWKRISPPKNDPVYAYADTIGGVVISVSQQPLPKSFVGDIDNQVAELAKKFNASDKITAGDTKAYIGTSSKGPQSVIFTKDNLLILIKSQKKLNNKTWTKYIASLH